ncbi:MAG: XRE family transcriptional regulator [Propionibacterium sp.]|nr:XRE family transcriptional regulator [Propionibacterium sp.]
MDAKVYADELRFRRAAAGVTQRELADASGVKQPLIAAIERGIRQPSDAVRTALDTALQVRPSRLLGAAREAVLAAVHAVGGTDVRVVGSVARGTDSPGSDLDLIVTFPAGADIVTLLTLEETLSELLTVPVDVVSAESSGRVMERALAEAIPL